MARRAKGAHIVVTGATAQNQHALLAQRRKNAPQRQVLTGIQAGAQTELHHRHISLRVNQVQGHKRAVVEATLPILRANHACTLQQGCDLRGQFRVSGCRVLHGIGIRRKAAVVIQHGGPGGRLHRELGLFPVRGNQEHCAGPLPDLGRHGAQRLGQLRMPGQPLRHPRPGAATVGDKVHRHGDLGMAVSGL